MANGCQNSIFNENLQHEVYTTQIEDFESPRYASLTDLFTDWSKLLRVGIFIWWDDQKVLFYQIKNISCIYKTTTGYCIPTIICSLRIICG